MLRRMGVRGKILATLAMPILVLAIAAGWVSWTSLKEATVAQQTADLVESLASQDVAGSAFATERSLSIAASMGIPGAKDGLAPAFEQTQAALKERDVELRAVDTYALDVRVRRAISATIADMDQVTRLQTRVAEGLPEEEATKQYTEYIENALDVVRELGGTTNDRTLALHLDAYAAMDETMLQVVLERPIVFGVLANAAAGRDVNSDLMLRAVTAIDETNRQFTKVTEQLDRLPGGYRLPAFDGPTASVRSSLATMDLASLDADAAGQWNQLIEAWVAEAQPARDTVRTAIAEYATYLADQARTTAILTASAAFGILALSVLIALGIARRIVRPLRRLTDATGEIRDRLPTMVEQMAVPGQASTVDLFEIPVESQDEIGRLAQSFNDVNATTVAVAKEQAALRGSIAEMFVNVARRDQVLLNRQLAFLDDLERSEEDPSTLSNLFRLDHLATRMRRNAESLLVLAGIDTGRRVRQPMPMSDVIRTASSEIELYDRVRLDLRVDPLMLGHNALNAAHLLAELLENATMFSEPTAPVEVTTSYDQRGVVVTVRDHGLGMTPEEIAEANQRVVSRSAQDAVGAQRLGLYVVGRLSDRLGASVGFSTGDGGTGTTVSVLLPAVLFVPDGAVPLPEPTDPLDAQTQREAASLGQLSARGLDAAPRQEPAVQAPPVQPAPVQSAPVQPAQAPQPAPVAAQQPLDAFGQVTRAALGAVPAPVEPEAPAAIPVDLDALTDGTTSSGMPRRRTAVRADAAVVADPIVLPPIEAPELPADLGESDTWAPPTDIEASGYSLPSRPRAEAVPEQEPAPISAPVLAVEQRSALFSSFRSFNDLDDTVTGTLHLDASVEDPATLPEAPRIPEPAATSAPVLAEPDATPAPFTGGAPAPFAFGAPPSFTSLGSVPVQPEAQTAPAAPAPAPSSFDQILAAGPSTDSTSEAAMTARKRGLFGRRPQDDTTRPHPVVPAADASPFPPVSVDTGFTPQPYAPLMPSSSEPLPAARATPFTEPEAEPAYAQTVAATPDLDVPPAPWNGLQADQPASESVDDVQGRSVLPLRTASDAPAASDPLDPYAIPDTVAARSEWMASAVLYEEMSSLLRRGVFEEDAVSPKDDTYRPLSSPTADSPGLARRTARATVNPATDRFTARIERDPEQLRSRLSEFQSATTRGRSAIDSDGASTWAPAP